MSNSSIVDRRLNGRNRSLPNRERFIRRYKTQLRKAVSDVAGDSSITDVSSSDKVKVRIPIKDVDEPHFVFGSGGNSERVIPGNRDFVPGDRIPKPKGQGQGDQGGQAGQGESDDSFSFVLSREEFLNLYFDDLELPELLKREISRSKTIKSRNAGFSRSGPPTSLSVVRTMKASLMRRIALSAKDEEESEEDEEIASSATQNLSTGNLPTDLIPAVGFTHKQDETILLPSKIKEGQSARTQKKRYVPFLDEIDLRYRHRVFYPEAATNAVMFCLMDVSASMDEAKKDLAKRFFTLLYLFLTQKYDDVQLVFVRHTDEAEEVNEEEFFHSRKSGGTEVCPALELAYRIMKDRFPVDAWNIYVAQASDGDATSRDAKHSATFLANKIMPIVRYYAYVETMPTPMFGMARASDLWENFEPVESQFAGHFAMRKLFNRRDIYPVFRGLFEKKSNVAFGR